MIGRDQAARVLSLLTGRDPVAILGADGITPAKRDASDTSRWRATREPKKRMVET